MHVQQKSANSQALREPQFPEGSKGSNLDAWREQVDMARRESANAYVSFLDSLLLYHREISRIAERGEGSKLEEAT